MPNKASRQSCDYDDDDDTSCEYGNPLQYFVFIFGHCDEWPENRETQGDIGLYKAYLEVGIPQDQIILITDKKKLTKESCHVTLVDFLQSETIKAVNKEFDNQTTLIFYYGGHGTSAGFSTRKEEWKYRDVIDLIDNQFDGQRVIIMGDCCGSGNLCHILYEKEKKDEYKSKKKIKKMQYVCLANTAAYQPASTLGVDDEWIMNYCWIECLKRNSYRHSGLSLYQILYILVDRNAMKLGDQLTIYLSPDVDINSNDWLPTTKAKTTVTTITKLSKTSKVTTTTTTTTTRNVGRKKRQRDDIDKTAKAPNYFEMILEYCYSCCCCSGFGFNEQEDEEESEDSNYEEEIIDDDKWKNQFENYKIQTKAIVSSKWTVGDTVFYKYPGGYPPSNVDHKSKNYDVSSSSSSLSSCPVYVPPGWMRATIISEETENGHDDSKQHDSNNKTKACCGDDDATVQLLVTYPVKQVSWIVDHVCRNTLINDIHMGEMYIECDNYKFYNKIQCWLATKYIFIDYSIQPQTKLLVKKKSGNNVISNNDIGDTITVKSKPQNNDNDSDRQRHDANGTRTISTSHKQHQQQLKVEMEDEEAIVLDWKDFDWKSYYDTTVANVDESKDADANGDVDDTVKDPSIQPYISIRWLSSDKTELLPLEFVIPTTTVLENTLLSALQRAGKGSGKPNEETNKQQHQEQLQRNALIASIESSGKTICNAKTKFFGGGDDDASNSGNDSNAPNSTLAKKQLIAFWPEDRKWYDAVPLDPDTISLEVLASHALFIPQGLYCPLLYEDGASALSPLHYVRVRSERKKKKKK